MINGEGKSEVNWVSELFIVKDDLFGDIPVGIGEFMKTEKKLKEKQRKQWMI